MTFYSPCVLLLPNIKSISLQFLLPQSFIKKIMRSIFSLLWNRLNMEAPGYIITVYQRAVCWCKYFYKHWFDKNLTAKWKQLWPWSVWTLGSRRAAAFSLFSCVWWFYNKLTITVWIGPVVHLMHTAAYNTTDTSITNDINNDADSRRTGVKGNQ